MSRAQRTKALADFQNDPPTTIFLLSTRAAACGINLTQANHCFLLEPCFNVAVEEQAIGRVYRMGQKRPVSIVRLVTRDTIEENMLTHRTDTAKASATSAPAAEMYQPVGSVRADGVKTAYNFDKLFGVEPGEAALPGSAAKSAASSTKGATFVTPEDAPAKRLEAARRQEAAKRKAAKQVLKSKKKKKRSHPRFRSRGGCSCGNCSDDGDGDCVLS